MRAGPVLLRSVIVYYEGNVSIAYSRYDGNVNFIRLKFVFETQVAFNIYQGRWNISELTERKATERPWTKMTRRVLSLKFSICGDGGKNRSNPLGIHDHYVTKRLLRFRTERKTSFDHSFLEGKLRK